MVLMICPFAGVSTLMFPDQAPNGGADIPEEFLQLGRQMLYCTDLSLRVRELQHLQHNLARPGHRRAGSEQFYILLEDRGARLRALRTLLPVLNSSFCRHLSLCLS